MSSEAAVKHPAKFSEAILPVVAEHVQPGWCILDPFAGVGGVHQLMDLVPGCETVGVEIEPEWAHQHPRTVVGNALRLDGLFEQGSFDAVVSSCCYGNRMSDHHEARDASKRITYRHFLGRPLTPGSTAGFQFTQPQYKMFHEQAWWQVARVLANRDRPRRFVLNVSDHIRREKVQRVVDWHLETLERFGFTLECRHEVATPRMGFGANGDSRVEFEVVACLTGPETWNPTMPGRLL